MRKRLILSGALAIVLGLSGLATALDEDILPLDANGRPAGGGMYANGNVGPFRLDPNGNLYVVISGGELELGAAVDIGEGPFKVTDGGGSLTVDGTVAAAQSGTWTVTANVGTGTQPVSSTDLDIRDLSSATDSVAVLATDLDIRDLSAATDTIQTMAMYGDAYDGTWPVSVPASRTTFDIDIGADVMWALICSSGPIGYRLGATDAVLLYHPGGNGCLNTEGVGGFQHVYVDTDTSPAGAADVWIGLAKPEGT